MRELNHIQSILNKVIQRAGENNSKRITSLHLAIGEIFELDQNIIQGHWNNLSKGTQAEHAQLHFRLIPAEVQCMSCFKKYHPVNKTIHCANCESYGAKILSGEEFYLESIETDHE